MPWPSKPYAKWESADLAELLMEPKPEENAWRDYKQEYRLFHENKKLQEDDRLELLKDVSAMANSGGGVLLLGVRQIQDPTVPQVPEDLVGVPAGDVEKLRTTMRSLVDTHLDGRPAPLRFHAIDTPQGPARQVLLVEVPQNNYTLSMVTYLGANQFWVRRGDGKCPMKTDEIQYDFGRMEKVRQTAWDELEAVWARMHAWGSRLIWFAAVPMRRQRDHVPVNVEAVREVIRTSSYFQKYSGRKNVDGYTGMRFAMDLRPTLHGMGIRPDLRRVGTLEVRRDGTLVMGSEPVWRAEKPEEYTPLPLWELYEAWLSSLYLFKDIQERFGFAGVAVAQAGLVGCHGLVPYTEASRFIIEMQGPDFRIGEVDLTMEGVLLAEEWSPEDVFHQWAVQFANSLGLETPIADPPWVTESPSGAV